MANTKTAGTPAAAATEGAGAPAKKVAKKIASKAAVAPKPVAKKAAKNVAKPAAKAPTKPAPKPAAEAIAKPARPAAGKGAKTKHKLVRDSFTMPRADFDLIAALKDRALNFKRPTKKSELLRAGLHVLSALNDAQLRISLEQLTRLKPGRPAKGD